jgi:mono/diheme cytochrome c family protein
MRWFPPAILLPFSLTFFFFLHPSSAGQQPKSDPKDSGANEPISFARLRPLLKTYCLECHNTNKKKAGLDLEKFETEKDALDQFEMWEQVGEHLRTKAMPPPKKKQPTEAERQQILAWVKQVARSQVDYFKLPREELEPLLAGPVMNRRLSRMEYNNTVRDLFGVDLHPGDLLPSEGGGGEGFDNAGATLFTTPVLMEKYLEAAELVLGTIFPRSFSSDKDQKSTALEAEQLKAIRNKLMLAVPDDTKSGSESARQVLAAFLPKAFRRPVTAKEIERYLNIFEKATQRGDSYDQAVKVALKAVLISPSFLFLIETPAENNGVYQLGHYEVASHLSYFLWGSMPDEELTKLASEGKLHDEAVLRHQVQRMMRDPRARSLADGFAAQWLGIRPLGTTIRPDARLFPEFNEELAAAMREETVQFIQSIISEDHSLLEVIDSDYTFINERLAALYKIDGIKGTQMQRVHLDDTRRGGILGQASILTVTSFPHRTSPVLRGKWILEELLGTEVPPPPPDVPVLNERRRGEGDAQTVRQLLEKHRSKAECAGCHSRMDPLGFGLENFDPLGRWRTEQAGKPIDSEGVLPTGEKFRGPMELKMLLLEKRRPDFLRNLSRKMLGYGLAREINRPDMCVAQDCVVALEKGDFRASRLLETIVLSYPFSHRNQKE